MLKPVCKNDIRASLLNTAVKTHSLSNDVLILADCAFLLPKYWITTYHHNTYT